MIPDTIEGQIADLYSRIAESERRARNRRRTGVVEEVDHANGKYRVRISETNGRKFLTDWIRTRQLGAGGVKIDVLLYAGEQVDVFSENGDMTDAHIDLSTYSESNQRENSNIPFQIKIGDALFNISGGNTTIANTDIVLKGHVFVDGTIENNGKNIGKGHKHVDVEEGTGISGIPIDF